MLFNYPRPCCEAAAQEAGPRLAGQPPAAIGCGVGGAPLPRTRVSFSCTERTVVEAGTARVAVMISR